MGNTNYRRHKMRKARLKELTKFLQDKYIERWRKRGKRISQNEWAREMDINPASMSQWMTGTRLPTGENVHKLALNCGLEIYDILGLPRRMPSDRNLIEIAENWHLLEAKDRVGFMQFYHEMIDDIKERRGLTQTTT
jgi:transcriptional regulator with XRE-family HTH domain